MQISRKPSVLAVDDDKSITEFLKLILRNEGYKVVGQAANGAEAVQQCLELKPDIVLPDINMPIMNGIQALGEILKTNPAIIVLMISGDSTLTKVKEALDIGAAGFVAKPLTQSSIVNMINSCMKKWDVTQHRR